MLLGDGGFLVRGEERGHPRENTLFYRYWLL